MSCVMQKIVYMTQPNIGPTAVCLSRVVASQCRVAGLALHNADASTVCPLCISELSEWLFNAAGLMCSLATGLNLTMYFNPSVIVLVTVKFADR